MNHIRPLPCVYVALISLLLLLTSCSGKKIATDDNFDMVELPDGSLVFLNHNSSLSFSEDFRPREVRTSGDVFFVVEQGQDPFTVETEHGLITVHGTEFSVKSNRDEFEVEVEGGIVEVQSGEINEQLKGGQRAAFSKGEKTFRKGKAEFRFRLWMRELEVEFKKLGREFKHGSKQFGKESKKAGKKLKRELKSLKPDK